VGDDTGVLVKLLSEEVNSKVAVLASLGGGADANDLARATLKIEDISSANVVAGNGHGFTSVRAAACRACS